MYTKKHKVKYFWFGCNCSFSNEQIGDMSMLWFPLVQCSFLVQNQYVYLYSALQLILVYIGYHSKVLGDGFLIKVGIVIMASCQIGMDGTYSTLQSGVPASTLRQFSWQLFSLILWVIIEGNSAFWAFLYPLYFSIFL